MPLFAHLPDDAVVTMCSTLDWDTLRPAERALFRHEVAARLAAGDRPDRLVPLACSKGKFKAGRFVDEDGNVYRLRDVKRVLAEVPETRADLAAYRRARAFEVGSTVVAVAVAPVALLNPITALGAGFVYVGALSLGTGVVATNANGSANAALFRAVTTYNATHFWHETEVAYAAPAAASVPTAAARTTELVYGALGCAVAKDDPRFAADAAVVWRYAEAGYDAAALVRAAEAAPRGACDVPAALAGVAKPTHTAFVPEPELDMLDLDRAPEALPEAAPLDDGDGGDDTDE